MLSIIVPLDYVILFGSVERMIVKKGKNGNLKLPGLLRVAEPCTT